MTQLLNTETRGRITILYLNSPENRNALSSEMITALKQAFTRLAVDDQSRAVVLTSSSPTFFCSGADLKNLKNLTEASSEVQKQDSGHLASLLEQMYHFPKPLIAATEGAVMAGGAGLASVCDCTIAAESTKFAYTEVKLGFVPAIVSVFLLRILGEKHAKELLLTGKTIGSAEAYRMGLVNAVVTDGETLSEALRWAEQMAHNSPTALATTKELIAHVPNMGLSEALRYASGVNAWIRTTSDLKEGVSSFLEKRKPKWQVE